MKKTLVFAVAVLITAVASAQTQSPKDILKQYNDANQAALDQAVKAHDDAAYEKAKTRLLRVVKDFLKSVDPTKIEAKNAYDWARLYALVEDNKAVCDLTHAYLRTNPGPKEKYEDQILMMDSWDALGEADMLKETLVEIRPPTPDDSASFAMNATGFINMIALKQGDEEGLRLLDKIQKDVTLPDPKADAQAQLDKEKDPAETGQPTLTEGQKLKKYVVQATRTNLFVLYGFATERASLLMDEGKRDKAIAALGDFEQNPDLHRYMEDTKDMSFANLVDVAIAQTKETGLQAPALTAEKTIGSFTSLANLRGKVVLLDFFAHWCGPCMDSIPSMVSMYRELHARGLEIVGVTQLYGFFAQAKNLSKHDEFEKLQALLAQKNMIWPVVVGPVGNATNYSVDGIPETVIIDKNGIVRNIWVGYGPTQEERIEKTVEKLLKE